MSPAHRAPWSAATKAAPIAAAPGRDFGARSYRRPLVGLTAVLAIVAVVALAVAQFRGDFNATVPITVMSDRAGLLMNPGARVKLNGAQIGTVATVNETPDGRAELQLAIDRGRLGLLSDNVRVEIGAATVFGAKSVEFTSPENPSTSTLRAGQVLDSQHVTVEVNTIFEQLNSVLAHIDPAKLNETLGALSAAFSGRGDEFGNTLTDVNSFLGKVEPSLPQLSSDLQMFPDVATAYADAAPDLVGIIKNATGISQTFVDEKSSLDGFSSRRSAWPTSATTSSAPIGAAGQSDAPPGADDRPDQRVSRGTELRPRRAFCRSRSGRPAPIPGVTDLAAFSLGLERYRYPQDLPKVAATGRPQCKGQLPLPFEYFPPKLIMDTGTNPYKYGNQGLLLNSDALKQCLFGPIDGPPRNTAQVGQAG